MGCEHLQRVFYPGERVALFIDGANLYQAARALGFDIDYRLLLATFAAECRLVRAFYYTALLDEQEYSPIRPLVDWLDYNGYTVVTKPLKEFTDAAGRRKFKGNMDIELAVDALDMVDHVEHIVLFSGDGDFRRLIESIQRKGVRVTAISTIRTQPPMIADELRRQADFFIDLRDLSGLIAREPLQREAPAPAATAAVTTAAAPEEEGDDEDGGGEARQAGNGRPQAQAAARRHYVSA